MIHISVLNFYNETAGFTDPQLFVAVSHFL